MKKSKRKQPSPARKPAKQTMSTPVQPHRFGELVIPRGAVLKGGISVKVY